MGAGVGQVIVGVIGVILGVDASFTTRDTLAVAELYAVAFEGVKVTLSVFVPAARTVPAAGE